MPHIKRTFIAALCITSLTLISSEKDKNKTEKPPIDLTLPRTGMGSDLAANAGLAATALALKTVAGWGASIKASASGAWLATKGAVMGVVSAPATPYVAGGVAATYVGHKVYRSYYPTPEQQKKNTEHERKAQENLEQTEIAKCRRQRSKSVQNFSSCLSRNRRSTTFTSQGYPTECEDDAFTLALEEDGETEVVSLAKRFVKFAPMAKRDDNK